MKVVILAGGRGTRLAPYTSILPKPLLPVDGRSVLEVVVERLAECGFDDIIFSVGYLGHLIEAVFGDGSSREVDIRYLRETEPLGTAGPLRNIRDLDETFIVMNGDVLTDLDPRDLVGAHEEAGNEMTIATRRRVAKIDYGVLHLDGHGEGARVNGSRGPANGSTEKVSGFSEKPEVPAVVSMGIYAMEPSVLDFIPERAFDIPDLVLKLLDAEMQVGAYLFDGFWLDVGRPEDFQRAVELFSREPSMNGHNSHNGHVEAKLRRDHVTGTA